MNKVAFMTMDVESYYDTMCLKGTDIVVDDRFSCADQIDRFLSLLDKYNIKATLFVTVSFLHLCKNFLLKAIRKGHEIALHCYEHEILKDISKEEFDILLKKSKEELKKELGVEPVGYRFPCFLYRKELLDVLKENGFIFNSSQSMKEGNIYFSNNLYEIPLIHRHFLFKKILISGGAYGRIFPRRVYLRWVKRYIRKHDYFIFYFHPFEIYEGELPLPSKTSFNLKYFINKGRDDYLNRIEEIIHFLNENDYQFYTIKEYLEHGRKA